MPTVFARAGSMEAPMPGLEFTNRANTIPVWRLDAQAQAQAQARANTQSNGHSNSLKRSHSFANPRFSPFDPQKSSATLPKPVFGENLHYLFRPPELSHPCPQTQPPLLSPWTTTSASACSSTSSSSSIPPAAIPEIDMQDVELSPWRPAEGLRGFEIGVKDLASNINNVHNKPDSQGQRENDDNDSNAKARRISNAAVRRAARRRAREAGGGSGGMSGRARSTNLKYEDRSDSDEEGDESTTDEEDSSSSTKNFRSIRKMSNHYMLNLSGPAPKGDLPYILLGYTQFLFNLSLILVFLYLLVKFIYTVQQDVEQRITQYSMEILQEISTCAAQFKQNLCESTAIPALLHQCAAWKTCMSRDPSVVGRARVGAEMLAEVVNSFVEPISWKTLLFTLSSLAFMTLFINALLSLYRSRHAPHPSAQPHPQPHVPSAQHHSSIPGAQMPFAPPAAVTSLHAPLSYFPHKYDVVSGTQDQGMNRNMGQPPQGQHQRLIWHTTKTEDKERDVPRQRRRLDYSWPR